MAYIPAEEDDEYDSEDGYDFDETLMPVKREKLDLIGPPIEMGQNQYGLGDGKSAASNYFSWSKCDTDFVLTMSNLKLAAIRGNVEQVKRGLSQGLSVDKPLPCGWTALMYAANNAHPNVVQLLVDNGASAKYQCDMFTSLMCASSASSRDEDKVQECVRILMKSGAEVNENDRYHMTPLMMASREGHLLAVKELITGGAEVNKQDSRGWTALTWAAQRSNRSVVMELLDCGADPNVRHVDSLTVKDLAACLPTDEILALLEHRQAVHAAGDSRTDTNWGTLTDTGDFQVKTTDLRYGEMEIFLLGLELPHLVKLFQQQLIDLNLLLTLSEQDLINAGVDQVGARKKLLDAVQAVHKKDWQPSSLVSIYFNKQISCADAVAMVANSSKHMRYIGSTIVYVREQLKRHPDSVLHPTDMATPTQLQRHLDDAIQNTNALIIQLVSLQSDFRKEMGKRNANPADLIHSSKLNRKSHFIGLLSCVVFLITCFPLLWYRRTNLFSHISASIYKVFVRN